MAAPFSSLQAISLKWGQQPAMSWHFCFLQDLDPKPVFSPYAQSNLSGDLDWTSKAKQDTSALPSSMNFFLLHQSWPLHRLHWWISSFFLSSSTRADHPIVTLSFLWLWHDTPLSIWAMTPVLATVLRGLDVRDLKGRMTALPLRRPDRALSHVRWRIPKQSSRRRRRYQSGKLAISRPPPLPQPCLSIRQLLPKSPSSPKV